MAHRVDPAFMDELAAYGAPDAKACFNCGNCTAVCALSGPEAAFPRKLIRYAQLGLKERLAASWEIWLCYYCADCSATCPRQAGPGEFVAAVRRYVTARCDPTTLARRLYTSRAFTAGFLAAVTAVLAFVLLSGSGPMRTDRLDLGGFISAGRIEHAGYAVMLIAGAVALSSLTSMVRRLRGAAFKETRPQTAGWAKTARRAFSEAVSSARFARCGAYGTSQGEKKAPFYLGRRFVHLSIMWGFIGLLAAAAMDALFKTPFSRAAFFDPARLLGTAAGLFVLFGTSAVLIGRARKRDRSLSHSLLSDWLFPALLWGVALSGFIVEFAGWRNPGAPAVYYVFAGHTVAAMILVLLFPFTKFAHAALRPAALFIHELLYSGARRQ